ncbi:MAG: response regulator [Bacteroidota bacterium]|nr:response regulator [Bacteroidota bacterium]
MKKVLIADDTKNIRKMLAAFLEIEGYEIIEASDGINVLEILAKGKVDLIFLDIKMPQMSGTEVLRRIRAIGDSTPVIIMTAFATVKNAIECTKLGAVSYLQKPFTVEKIKATLNNIDIDCCYNNYQSIEQEIIEIENNIYTGQYSEAVARLKKIISIETDNPKVYLLLSKAYEGLGDKNSAEKFFYAFKMFT